eukprot:g49513.t1
MSTFPSPRHSRPLLRPSTNNVRSSSVPSTPVARSVRNHSSALRNLSTDSTSSRRASQVSSMTDSECSTGSVGKSLSADEVLESTCIIIHVPTWKQSMSKRLWNIEICLVLSSVLKSWKV